jgi:gentisate 1,2-dioxygenase
MTASLFRDQTGRVPEKFRSWSPVHVSKEQIDSEIERLASLPMPANGRRRSLIVHPENVRSSGIAPGIQVALDVLRPGEKTIPYRQNSTQVTFVIHGAGRASVGGRQFDMNRYDVCNTPSMHVSQYENTGDGMFVRLTYSNAALLEMMNASWEEESPAFLNREVLESQGATTAKAKQDTFDPFQITDQGAWLMPYETLINPAVVESKALHWPWALVKSQLDRLGDLNKEYVGRRLYGLYNPMTGRTNGITPNFFATITIRPPKIVDQPHRHMSTATTYFFQGSGRSTVDGQTFEWKAGDLMLSAPSWAVHNSAANDESVYELTIQDQPLNIAMESLLWQESLKLPMALLGVEEGFGTNREAAE